LEIGQRKAQPLGWAFLDSNFNGYLKLFVKVASRAGDIDSAWNAALTIFHPLYDAGRFVALGTVG
jgi:hypothetical protein